jgi:hypothetical protein
MLLLTSTLQRVAVLAIGLALAGALAAARAEGDSDDALIRGYKLSMNKVQHYVAAKKELDKQSQSNSAIGDEVKRMQQEPQRTIADLRAMMTHHPKIYAIFKREGLSEQDTVMIPVVLGSALMAIDPRNPNGAPPDVSEEQIAFARQHEQELKALIGGPGGPPPH